MDSLAGYLVESAGRFADRPAIRLDDEVMSYHQLVEASARVAGWLSEQGMAAGDRVGVMLPNVPAFPLCTTGYCGPAVWSCP
jgi:long-chain acyl-CoA synthetase